ncbi:dolabradiene monooxygenase-like isoform X2 [Panicum virgatum]|uniref:dolabradiene monooxygenase-like isoform X2 n=1 Tax=Panicum virgatum TaxID=38727 RepID=UPI0019D63CC7|nr:dolabradiene monooxygenase-like isoform X2 [Panicum virgatum]
MMEATATTLPLLGLLLLLPLFLMIKLVARSYALASPSSQPGKKPPLRLPPGPWQLPLIGSLPHLLLSPHGGLAHRALRDLSARHGPLMMLRLGAVPTLVVSSAEAAREVMRTHDAAFASRSLTPTLAVFGDGGRDILFSPYGDLWRQLRRICVLELLSPRRVRSFRRIREEEAAGLLRSVAASCAAAHAQGGSAVVDVGERICRAMDDIVVRSAVGGRFPRCDEFLRELNTAVMLTSGFNLTDLYPSSPLVRWLSRGLREAQRCNRAVRDIVAEIIREQSSVDGGREEQDDDDEDGDNNHLLAVLLRLERDGDAQGPLTTHVITTVVLVGNFCGGERDLSNNTGMGTGGADKEPTSDAESSSGAARGLQGPAQADRGRHGEAPLPAPGGEGDAAPAHPRPVPAPARVPGGVPGDGLRRAQGHQGARQRVGDREGPELLGEPGGVQAGEVRGARRRRGLQGRRLRVHPLRRRPADVRRRGARTGQHGGGARGAALPLRL